MNCWAYKTRCVSVLVALVGCLALVTGWLLWRPAPAWAVGITFPSPELQSLTSLHRGASLADSYQPLTTPIMDMFQQEHEEPLRLIEDIILAENWYAWRMFQATPGMAVPLASAQIYIIFSGAPDKRSPLRIGERGPKAPSVRVEVMREIVTLEGAEAGVGSGVPLGLGDLFVPSLQESPFRPGLVTTEVKRRLNLKEPYRLQEQGFSITEFLTEGDGPLSGQPWTWENFIPRLLIILAYVVVLLFGVEILRHIIAIGLRGMSRGRGGR